MGHAPFGRSGLGGLVRAVTTAGVKKLARATEPVHALRDRVVTLSVDAHVIARFTRKFKITKGYHSIRGKKMRAEKLFYLYWPAARRFLGLAVTRGNASLVEQTIGFIRSLRRRAHLRQLRVILDADASTTNAALQRLARFHKTVFLIRAPRRTGYVDRWKRLPRAQFTSYEEPGRYRGAKPKEIEVAETTTAITGIARPIRTIVVRELPPPGPHERMSRAGAESA